MAQANFSKASKKYDIPIYSAAWINSPTPITEDDAKDSLEKENKLSIVVGGGGGDRKHGIKNRLVVADYDFKSEELSDEVGSIERFQILLFYLFSSTNPFSFTFLDFSLINGRRPPI